MRSYLHRLRVATPDRITLGTTNPQRDDTPSRKAHRTITNRARLRKPHVGSSTGAARNGALQFYCFDSNLPSRLSGRIGRHGQGHLEDVLSIVRNQIGSLLRDRENVIIAFVNTG